MPDTTALSHANTNTDIRCDAVSNNVISVSLYFKTAHTPKCSQVMSNEISFLTKAATHLEFPHCINEIQVVFDAQHLVYTAR